MTLSVDMGIQIEGRNERIVSFAAAVDSTGYSVTITSTGAGPDEPCPLTIGTVVTVRDRDYEVWSICTLEMLSKEINMFGFLKALARNDDPITSDLAAEQVDTNHLEQVVLCHLKFWPAGLTCREIANSTGLELGSITPRMKPLETRGLVVRDGTRRVRGCRNASIVWKAVQEERKLL